MADQRENETTVDDWQICRSDNPRCTSEGDFVTIGFKGETGISMSLSIGFQEGDKCVRIEYSKSRNRLRFTPLKKFEFEALKIQTPGGNRNRQRRVATGSKFTSLGICRKKAVRYAAEWNGGAIIVDLNSPIGGTPGEIVDEKVRSLEGEKVGRSVRDSGDNQAVRPSDLPIFSSAVPRVRCSACGRIVDGVRRGKSILASVHNSDHDGTRCPGGLRKAVEVKHEAD